MGKLILGIGINDRSISSRIDGNVRKEYHAWRNMLVRVTSKEYQEQHKTYEGTTISEMFTYYHLFYKWCQEQVGFGKPGYCLDKDLIIKGNRHYSENTCVFIPYEINLLLTKTNANRGDLPIGVCLSKGKYVAHCKVNGHPTHIGSFDTALLAFEAYKHFKENRIKEQAEIYKDSIDVRAYEALLNYKVEIGD